MASGCHIDRWSPRTKAAASLAGFAGAAAVVFYLKRRAWLREQQDRDLRVSLLVVYPIKGCKGIQVQSARLFREGLEHDREFVIARPGDAPNKVWEFASQRTFPRMALIETTMPSVEGTITLQAPGMPILEVSPLTWGSEQVPLDIWGDAARGLDCGEDVASWLCRFLETDSVRLLRHTGTRRIDETYAIGVTRFADGFPLLVTTEASLEDVERSTGLDKAAQRFRPNLVLRSAVAYDEDMAKGVVCGVGARAMKFRFVKPCARCQVPRVDPATGKRGKDPLSRLKEYRSGRVLASRPSAHQDHFRQHQGEIFFGQNAIVELSDSDGSIAVGDPAVWLRSN